MCSRYDLTSKQHTSTGALDVKLTDEDMKYLEEPYKAMGIFLYN